MYRYGEKTLNDVIESFNSIEVVKENIDYGRHLEDIVRKVFEENSKAANFLIYAVIKRTSGRVDP